MEREPAVPSERGGEERPDDRPKCPDGHVLEEDFVSGSEGYCDVCNGIFSRFANMMSCFQCQFYMCEGCYVKRKRAIREELKIDFRYTPEEERRPPAVVLSGRLASTPAVPRERGGARRGSQRPRLRLVEVLSQRKRVLLHLAKWLLSPLLQGVGAVALGLAHLSIINERLAPIPHMSLVAPPSLLPRLPGRCPCCHP